MEKKVKSTKLKKNTLNEKLDQILENQKVILRNEKKILNEEKEIEKLEKKDLANDEKIQLSEKETLAELEKLESKINKGLTKPLKSVTKRDMFKGFIGAFVGVMGHFAFSKASDFAGKLNLIQITNLYLVAAIIIGVMLYYTGFRNVEKQIVMKFMPLRATVLYTVSIITIIIVNLLFGKIHLTSSFTEVYSLVGASIILAVMGAGTADLIGKVEH